jgi:transcriptional regulator with XRE-family HTH domain
MEGSELKAARKSLGATQAQVGAAIGLSQAHIGLMERGVKPIERRTELAMLWLLEHPEALAMAEPTQTVASRLGTGRGDISN